VKLEIGPSSQRIWPDCDTLDMIQRPLVKHVARWGYERLPFDDNTYEAIYSSHVLEHIPWNRTQDALGEVYRILKPGGTFEVWVPNFEVIVQCYLNGKFTEDWTPCNPNRDIMLWVAGRLYWGDADAEDGIHRACFDWPYLERCLRLAGFVDVERLQKPPERQQVNHQEINLGARARK
jgi:SAM-dependent methyltransferase